LVIRKDSLLLLLFSGLAVAACTTTAPPSQSTPVATAATAPKSEPSPESLLEEDPSKKQVCQSVIPTGTRFERRVCMTQAEWDKRKEDDRASGEKMQRKGVYGNPREPCTSTSC
jgi:hypothetical protein